MADAKVLGKRKLEAHGLSADFDSYMPAGGQPAYDPGDDDAVSPGSTLTFTATEAAGQPLYKDLCSLVEVLREECRVMRKGTSRRLLRDFVTGVTTRVVGKKGPTSSADLKQAEGMQGAVVKQERVRNAVHKFLSKADPALQLTEATFAKALDANYSSRNDAVHVNDDARLEEMAEELNELGAISLLAHSMPVECEVLKHYKELL